MNPEGQLRITLAPGGGVAIVSSRLLALPRLFRGKRPEEVIRLVTTLYRICGTAQGMAAALAMEAAQGIACDPALHGARLRLLWLETAKEHLWRILADWPRFLGREPDHLLTTKALRLLPEARQTLFSGDNPFLPGVRPRSEGASMNRVQRDLTDLLTQTVFGEPPSQWLERLSESSLQDWIDRGEGMAAQLLRAIATEGGMGIGDLPLRHLPVLSPDELHGRLSAPDGEQFVMQPDWHGYTWETGPMTRQRDHDLVRQAQVIWGQGLMTRLLARLVELACIPGQMTEGGTASAGEATSPAAGIGIGQVEAARGRLIHWVRLEGDRVSDYRILAPTEWNFHPRGVLARLLATLPQSTPETLRRQAELLINAVDPCVGYELILGPNNEAV